MVVGGVGWCVVGGVGWVAVGVSVCSVFCVLCACVHSFVQAAFVLCSMCMPESVSQSVRRPIAGIASQSDGLVFW